MRNESGRRIFGPVPSRRLGLSLGVDVIPAKTCTFDCVYCECGATTEKTCGRRAFYPVRQILDELAAHLSRMKEHPDVITVSGSGEPTLYLPLGELIDGIRSLSALPIAVITNSSLLWMEEVRRELSGADIVLPSLDAADEASFKRINRPHEACTLARVIDGLERFLAEWRGTALVEILLVEGYNANQRNLDALRAALGRMRTGRIQLNTAVRPGTDRRIVPLDEPSMERIRAFFGPTCEVIASARTTRMSHEDGILEDIILPLVERRPCTADDIASVLGVPRDEVIELMGRLEAEGRVVRQGHGGAVFWSSARGSPEEG
jgi:wyosine [tRNA(Phe)-imidazoG37] synthetase (radical SAM superfamily)